MYEATQCPDCVGTGLVHQGLSIDKVCTKCTGTGTLPPTPEQVAEAGGAPEVQTHTDSPLEQEPGAEKSAEKKNGLEE